jgi:hypothetical protein
LGLIAAAMMEVVKTIFMAEELRRVQSLRQIHRFTESNVKK